MAPLTLPVAYTTSRLRAVSSPSKVPRISATSISALPENTPPSAMRMSRLFIDASTRPSTTRISQSVISDPFSLMFGPTISLLPSSVRADLVASGAASSLVVSTTLEDSAGLAGYPEWLVRVESVLGWPAVPGCMKDLSIGVVSLGNWVETLWCGCGRNWTQGCNSNRRASTKNLLINRQLRKWTGPGGGKIRPKRRLLATPNRADFQNNPEKQKDRMNYARRQMATRVAMLSDIMLT